MLTFGSLFAGIGGFDLGFDRSGMQCAWQVERDPACNRVLARHWPGVAKCDDVNRLRALVERRNAERVSTRVVRPDLICGGFPCQDLSVAGRRAGLAGHRSGLWFVFRRIIGVMRPRWVCIENVPGLLSSNGGRDMGTILGALGQMGYGWAYRVLDAQWFGVPQRRRRVFIVGCLGDWRRAARVLFEPESLPWDSPPSRQAGARVARCLATGTNGSRFDGESEEFVAHTLRAEGHDASEDGTGRGAPLVPVAFAQNQRDEMRDLNNLAGALAAEPGMKQQTYVMQERMESLNPTAGPNGKGWSDEGVAFTLEARHRTQSVAAAFGIRRLTPRECERLQGFPDDWTRYAADGQEMSNSARYRMLGNAVCVNVAEWIGRRIVEAIG